MAKKKLKLAALEFETPKDMLAFLRSGDLYNPQTGTYVFSYNDRGSICEYNLDEEEVHNVIETKYNIYDDDEQYWGGFLPGGGAIYDMPDDEMYEGGSTSLDYCEEHYRDAWVDCMDYERVLKENATRYAVRIKWDIDYDEGGPLPEKLPIPPDMWDWDEISDYISDVAGYCHEGYHVKFAFDERPVEIVESRGREDYDRD